MPISYLFQGQDAAYLLLPSSTERSYFSILIGAAFGCKALDLLYMIWTQTSIDIFFIDWEKPRGSSSENSESNRSDAPISIWRTYFVANEWNEIQVDTNFHYCRYKYIHMFASLKFSHQNNIDRTI